MKHWPILTLAGFVLVGQVSVQPPTSVKIWVDGNVIGTVGGTGTLKFISGTGVVFSGVTLASGEIDITASMNSAVAISYPDAQAAKPIDCASHNGTIAYVCSLPVKAVAIPRLVLFTPDVPCAGACTLAVDQTGSKAIKRNDGGATDAAVSLGQHLLSFDAGPGIWRLLL
jgi:hypothetical protein